MSYQKKSLKALVKQSILWLAAVLPTTGFLGAQDDALFRHLPANPDAVGYAATEKVRQIPGFAGMGGDGSDTSVSSMLIGIDDSQSEGVLTAIYELKDSADALKMLSPSAGASGENPMAGLTSFLGDRTLYVEKMKSAVPSQALDRAGEKYDLRSHSGTDYYLVSSLPDNLKDKLPENTAFYFPSDDILVAGSEDLVLQSIDVKAGGSRPDLMDMADSGMGAFMTFRIPEGALSSDLLGGNNQNPLLSGMMAMLQDVRVATIGLSPGADTMGLKFRMQFSNEDSLNGLKAGLQGMAAQMAAAPEGAGGMGPIGDILKGLNISSEGDKLSISTSIPTAMMQLGAAGGAGMAEIDKSQLPQEVRLVDGSTIKGEVVDPIDEGIVVDLETGGGYSRRIHWSEMDIPTLEAFDRIPQTRQFVRDYIPQERSKIKAINLASPPDVPRPNEGGGFLGALFSTPVGLAFVIVLYALNIWVGIEVAIFRGHPVALVGGASAIMPLISPLIFYFIPAEAAYTEEYIIEDEEEDDGTIPAAAPPSQHGGGAPKNFTMPEPEGGGLSLSGGKKAPSTEGALQPGQRRVYKRGEVTIDRHFIEQTFVPFFRTVVSGPAKDQVIDFKTPKVTVTAKRISRMSSNEVYVALQSSGAEKGVKFAEISEIVVRHKDDR